MRVSINLLVASMLLFCIGFSSCNGTAHNGKDDQPYLIILSLDGFRWDYCDYAETPTFDSLSRVGTKAQSVVPCFPTKTFPNHYSIATGLRPENHGLVLNSFYDPIIKKSYSIRDKDAVTNGEFYGGEPIWNVAEQNGVKTATLFWVGASAEINQQRPSYWSNYNEELSLNSRIDSIVNWLEMDEKNRPHLIMWYYHEPDNIGHIYGPNSPELISEIEKLDSFLNVFLTEVRKVNIFSEIDFIITSDHGMGELSSDKEVYLIDIIDTNDIEYYNGGNPIINFKVKDGKIDKVYNDLIKGSENIEVWKNNETYDDYHYGKNHRTLDITVVAEPYWSLYFSDKGYASKGTHGYSNTFKDMHSIFYAVGPSFKKNYIHPTFNNIDIYPLIGEIMDFETPASDGVLENTVDMVIKSKNNED